MIKEDVLRNLIKSYYPEVEEKQVAFLIKELARELEVVAHCKIRESINFERIKKMNT